MKRLFPILLAVVAAYAAEPAPPAAPAAWNAVLSNGFSVRHARHEDFGETTRLWLAAGAGSGYVDLRREQIVRFEVEETAPIAPSVTPPVPVISPQRAISAAAQKHSVDADFIASVVRAESSFNPKAVSPKGARGLMQLMPETASRLGVHDSLDPAANVDAGTRYLRSLLEQYHGDVARALAAYNAGPHRVAQYGGVPPYRETQAYVRRVIRDYNRQKLAQRNVSAAPSTHQSN